MYPSLSRFLSSKSDPHTHLEFSFAATQQMHRKDNERVFGVLKIKYLSLMNPINFTIGTNFMTWSYLVIYSTIMVEACLMFKEEECAAMYNTVETTAAES